MNDITRVTLCSACRQPINTSADGPDGARAPCPVCGATTRSVHLTTTDLLAVRSEVNLEMHGRSSEKRRRTPTSQKRHVREQYLSLGPSADGVRRRAHRIFDRDADVYDEIVTDEETGEIVMDLRQPVSAHRDRGTAKRQTFRDAVSWAIASMAPGERPHRKPPIT